LIIKGSEGQVVGQPVFGSGGCLREPALRDF
jgi:hypothetical protein